MINLNETPEITFSDILIEPQYSEIESRTNIDTSVNMGKFTLDLPVISSNMPQITGYKMVVEMFKHGGMGILHRFCSIEDNITEFYSAYSRIKQHIDGDKTCSEITGGNRHKINPSFCLGVSIGVKEEDKKRCNELFKAGARIITVDIAHGHSKNMKLTIQWMRREYGEEICIIGGNIATYEATMDLASWGVDIVKVGVGPGSRCSTRTSTGVGRAAGVAIIECKRAVMDIMKNSANNPDVTAKDIKIIADGGMSFAGDLPKVIALGADAGMFGKMIAGTTETPGLVYKNSDGQYRKNFGGSSSAENKGKDEFVEGFVSPVVFIGKVKYVLRSLDHGLRSAMSYSGCSNIKDFQKNVKLHVISNGSQRESKF